MSESDVSPGPAEHDPISDTLSPSKPSTSTGGCSAIPRTASRAEPHSLRPVTRTTKAAERSRRIGPPMSVSTTARRVIAANWIIDEGDHLRLRVTQDPTDNSRWFPPVRSRGLAEDLVETTVGPLGVVYASTVVCVNSPSALCTQLCRRGRSAGPRPLSRRPGPGARHPDRAAAWACRPTR